LTGTIQSTYIGYKAADLRRKIYSFNGADEYMKDKKNKWSKMEVKSYSYENLDNFSKPLVEKLTIEAEAFDLASSTHFLFNPFLLERWESNPFKSEQRIYPVDFAAPIDETIILNLDLPEGLDIEELPKNLALSLPNNGGRYILDVKKNNKRVTVSNSLLINRTVFSSEEYHYLKELFNHVVKTHNTDLLFVKK
jgi:hypothetical protein